MRYLMRKIPLRNVKDIPYALSVLHALSGSSSTSTAYVRAVEDYTSTPLVEQGRKEKQ